MKNLGRFSLQSLFRQDKLEPLTLSNFPWKLSSQVHQKPLPSVWESIKTEHLKNLGIVRARGLLRNDAYNFPDQFNADALEVFNESVQKLSVKGGPSQDDLEQLMDPGLASLYCRGLADLREHGQSIAFVTKSKPLLRINQIDFTYGPLPVPEDHIAQNWFNYITLIIPKDQSQFKTHQHQNYLLEQAGKIGCSFRLDCTIKLDLEFVLSNENELPLLRDQRSSIQVTFTSPHFNPWDEIFNLQEDGTWKLAFRWKIVDIDDVYKEHARNKVK
jgi:hypothetical protein